MNGQNKPKLQRTKTYRKKLCDLEKESIDEEEEFENLNIDEEFKKNN